MVGKIFTSEKQRNDFAKEWEEACKRVKDSGYDLSKIFIVDIPTNSKSRK